MPIKVFLFLLLIQSSLQLSTPSSPTYDAAVVEFNFGLTSKMDPIEKAEKNLKDYIDLMDKVTAKPDIIVFPEMTLNGMETAVEIPDVKDKISPCDSDKYETNSLVKKLSCSAVQHSHYLVVNIVTKAKCPDPEMIDNKDPRDCKAREDGFSYYNTNVVFDRNGTVISSYRKFNLFGEAVDKPFKPQMVTFETDFGVKFGHFICFDLMFREPAVELVRSLNVTDIIFPTMWFSEAPFLTSVQAQQNWAHSFNVNFLAAGANYPLIGSTGSGIYGGNKGAYVMDMSASDVSKVYTATVHKKIPENENVVIEHDIHRNGKNEMKKLTLKRDQLDAYDMTFLDDTDGSHFKEKNVCKDGFCCNLKVNYTIVDSGTKKHYQYALVFYHGMRTFDGFADGGVVACAVIACQTADVKSCGIRDENLENIHKWTNVDVSGKFVTKDGQFLYIPTSLDTSILPLQPEQFTYNVEHKNDFDEISIELKDKKPDLLSFGIYGRDFNAAVSVKLSLSLILFAFFTLFKLL